MPTTDFQFRIGSKILKRIDASKKLMSISRNLWMNCAISEFIRKGCKPDHCDFSMRELLTDRKVTTVRLQESLAKSVEDCTKEDGCTRSVWLYDAFLTYLKEVEPK